MKANKVTVKINTETLHIDSVPAMLYKVIESIRNEAESGSFIMSDGDSVFWETDREPVEI